MQSTAISIETVVKASLHQVWEHWTNPESIKQWNAASPDWHTPSATNDLRTGGIFTARMEARDGSVGFDFGGTYTDVTPKTHIAYKMDDDREVDITFEETTEGIRVRETFDIEHENPAEFQKAGWQAILDNFKRYVEDQEG
jgi:uncharacterized protein YndB with AHSA1/START domain